MAPIHWSLLTSPLTFCEAKPGFQTVEPDDFLPPPSHPNYGLWRNYAQSAGQRGWLVVTILQQFMDVTGKKILDVGCGEGGTAVALAKLGAEVTAIDVAALRVCRLKRKDQIEGLSISLPVARAEALPFQSDTFDVVILQDLLEHTQSPTLAMKEVTRVLKTTGIIYLSTPNRFSPINLLADPHWNLPIVAIFPRPLVGWAVRKVFNREERCRSDLAALLSGFELRRLFRRNGLWLQFVNRAVASAMLREPTTVLCNDFHLRLFRWLKKLHMSKILMILVNDRFGLFNAFLMPTWYALGRKA